MCHLNLATLTILAVVGDLHFALLGPQQCLGHLGHSMPTGELAMQEVTSAWLLHYIRPGKARHLAETIITVDNSAVLHPGIGYDEFLICDEAEKKLGRKSVTVFIDVILNYLHINKNMTKYNKCFI